MNIHPLIDPAKFQNPDQTADGSERAKVALNRLDTLWFNTGTLCNLACENCYIESSPSNDRLVYLTLADVEAYLDEINALGLGTREIGLTGGEPFMNPDIILIIETSLRRGFEVLVLTNAMKPMAHKRGDLLRLKHAYGEKLSLRISIDHYGPEGHEQERGPDSWAPTLEGLQWLSDNEFRVTIAGRTMSDEGDLAMRAGYRDLFDQLGIAINPGDPQSLILFPEMDEAADVPEVTVDCWNLLGVRPEDQMCATSRMVVRRKGAKAPVVVPCTLLPYQPEFEMGPNLQDSLGTVKLNHPHCARFCVLGGGSCTT